MPELPEVETIRRSLEQVAGKRVTGVTLLRTDIVKKSDVLSIEEVVGSKIREIGRRGKYLVIGLGTKGYLVIHFGMTGRLLLVAKDEPVARHTHAVIDLEGGCQLRYQDPRRFGGLSFMRDIESFFRCLGPEPLDPSFGVQELSRRVKGRAAPVKSVLLDQKVVAGIGNIYADEVLFTAGIHPARKACELSEDELVRLHAAIKEIITRAVESRGTTFRDYRDGLNHPGQFQTQLSVYGRAGQPCSKCGGPIERMVIGGRSTHYCATCQG